MPTLSSAPSLKYSTVRDEARLDAAGVWTAATAQSAEALLDQAIGQMRGSRALTIDMAAVEELDTYGAWLIERLRRGCKLTGARTANVPLRFVGLLDAVHET